MEPETEVGILIIDDEVELRRIVSEVLRSEGFSTREASDGMEGLRLFREQRPDCVLLDLNMPFMDGMTVMKEILKIDPDMPVIILTAHGDVATAVKAIKEGAYDFAVKPPDFEQLSLALGRAAERLRLLRRAAETDRTLRASLEHRLGRSAAIQKVIDQISMIANTDYSVVIEGETGTGKSVVAEMVHSLGARGKGPFVRVDIGLVPDHLVESELFGYRRGAFTGADRDKTGFFEAADGGTIFIDELENMSLLVQSKLLSVIEAKRVTPLGTTETRQIDCRIIAATNNDIRHSVTTKKFREDLYYRIAEFSITMPPLRDRKDDIPYFAEKFVREISEDLGRSLTGLTPDAVRKLEAYEWPGNIRELKNVVRRAVLCACEEKVRAEDIDLPGVNGAAPAPRTLRDALRELERQMICDALAFAKGNKSKASERLDMSYTNLLAKIKEYGITTDKDP